LKEKQNSVIGPRTPGSKVAWLEEEISSKSKIYLFKQHIKAAVLITVHGVSNLLPTIFHVSA
jgi:hypothetical protein